MLFATCISTRFVYIVRLFVLSPMYSFYLELYLIACHQFLGENLDEELAL